MEKELRIFENITQLNPGNISNHLNLISRTADNFVIELYKLGILDDDMLKHTIEVKNYTGRGYQNIPGNMAKHFVCNTPGYVYPLFKTHKVTPDSLNNISIFDLPTRLLQSAGNITTSKITAFLEDIYKPISIKFCKSGINEYCRDSKQYLQNLVEWTNTSPYDSKSDTLYIVAGDVKALYPSVKRSSVRNALQFALTGFSDFHPTAITNLIELTMFCHNNVVIQHKNKFFKQTEGIITGDNHSVSLANITLHHLAYCSVFTANHYIHTIH